MAAESQEPLPGPARHVEFFYEGDSDPGLVPFRIGINAAGDPFALGDPVLA